MRQQIIVAGLVLTAGLAACGPSPEPGVPPQPTTAPTAGPPAPVTAAPTPKKGSTPLGRSKLVEDVKKLGIDFATPLEKLPLGTKKKLMPLFQKALGFKSCGGCHAGGEKPDFKQETEHMKVARGMWNNFIVKLRDNDKQPIFCDTCHGGAKHVLDRSNKEAVQAFMREQYEGKLEAVEGDISCSTCHSDVFEPRIFAKLWGIVD